jgi:hypothetical protein
VPCPKSRLGSEAWPRAKRQPRSIRIRSRPSAAADWAEASAIKARTKRKGALMRFFPSSEKLSYHRTTEVRIACPVSVCQASRCRTEAARLAPHARATELGFAACDAISVPSCPSIQAAIQGQHSASRRRNRPEWKSHPGSCRCAPVATRAGGRATDGMGLSSYGLMRGHLRLVTVPNRPDQRPPRRLYASPRDAILTTRTRRSLSSTL